MNRILFVCTGNTCRSPMAEGLMRSILAEAGVTDVEVRSAGVAAYPGTPISDHANSILRERGCTVPEASTLLSQGLVDWADLVLTMTSSHKRHVIQLYPEALDKVFALKEYAQDDLEVVSKLAELESLMTDIQLKQALSETVTDDERKRIVQLQQELPSPDIADPFGGSKQHYDNSAREIEACLVKLVEKLKSGRTN